MINYFSSLYAKTLAGKLIPDLRVNLNGHPSIQVIQSRSELDSKSYIFMENDNHFTHKSVSTFTTCQNFMWIKNWIYIIYNSEKFQNQFKEQINIAATSNIIQGLILNMAVKST